MSIFTEEQMAAAADTVAEREAAWGALLDEAAEEFPPEVIARLPLPLPEDVSEVRKVLTESYLEPYPSMAAAALYLHLANTGKVDTRQSRKYVMRFRFERPGYQVVTNPNFTLSYPLDGGGMVLSNGGREITNRWIDRVGTPTQRIVRRLFRVFPPNPYPENEDAEKKGQTR